LPTDLPADLTIDVLRHDEAALVEQTHAMLEAAREADAPDTPPLLLRRFLGNLKWHAPGWEFRCYIARSGGQVIGALRADFPHQSNRHFTEGDLTIHPGHRRRGVGTALLEHYLDDARSDGRTEINMVGRATWGDGPERSEAGARFIERHGFTQALVEVDRACAGGARRSGRSYPWPRSPRPG
jgi:GNAT superfamily N-acetyltransferase